MEAFRGSWGMASFARQKQQNLGFPKNLVYIFFVTLPGKTHNNIYIYTKINFHEILVYIFLSTLFHHKITKNIYTRISSHMIFV